MIALKIGKEEFKLPESRKEVTIRKMLQFCEQIEPHQPPSMRRIAQYYRDAAKVRASEKAENVKSERLADMEKDMNIDLDELVKSEQPDQYYRYYAKVLSFFSGVPEEIMLQARIKDLEKFHGILLSLINTQEPDDNYIGFEFKGEKYVLPAREPIPMENGTLIEFLEAQQYRHYYQQLEESDGKDDMGFDVKSHYNALLPLICIIARKEGEAYYDDIVKDRSQLFLDLPLHDADQVFFYLIRSKIIYTEIINRLSAIGSELRTLQPEHAN